MISKDTASQSRAPTAHPLLNTAVMNKLLTVALSLPLAACVVGTGADPGDDTTPATGGGGGGGGGGGTSKADHITLNTMWTGTVDVARQTTVDPGVTLTIAPGTTVRFASGTAISVEGIVDVQGSKASPVQLSPATVGDHHYGFTVPTKGELKMTYGVQVGGGISVNGGKITITDSLMSQASGDFLVAGDGIVDVSYSSIGLETGTDTTHCDMHFGGGTGSVKVTHSNISTSSYGLMLYGGTNVDLTYNNWFKNPIQVDASPGVSGNVSNGWFDKAAPTSAGGATITANNLSATRLPSASVDPVNGAGPR